MKQFRLWNNIAGWIAFTIAAITYLSTIEYTASLWDCGEFIACAFKLEVGHPPGAPLFIMAARVFSLFAGNNVALVPIMVNIMSALASAFTILLLFWSITHLAKKIIIKKEENYTTGNIIAILGSGMVGALAYTFSDSFWFSAVEGEVYASSSLFTALVFWAMLKWEEAADGKYANRWILLIAYLMGLSIGVHLLNLLCIPALALIYYFKKYKPTIKGVIIAFSISVALVGFVMYGVIQGLFKIASKFELLFVNDFGLPYNSGIIFFSLIALAALIGGIYYTYKKKKVVLNTIILSLTLMILGYGSYAMIVIRANANPPLNENKPDNIFSIISYLDREQYGDRPLIYGQYYNAPILNATESKPHYAPINGKYEITSYDYDYEYDSRFTTIFPRMYSPNKNHITVYKDWGDVKGKTVQVTDEQGQTSNVQVPTFGENMLFFMKYQVGHMYMRYFMWNFVGRQNDEDGSGGILNGNWLSGINFIDNVRLGPQDNLPPQIKNNPSRNVYFFLPLILGIIGIMFHFERNNKDFWVVALLFFMTGLAIVIYLNQTPFQPRERDYSYTGSFYAFAIWIGLGVLWVYSLFKEGKKSVLKASATVTICLIAVPGIMASQNWNDHNRSGRYATKSYAYNYLNSCAPNAILFTFGDNDTFPLWYLQEVEGIRTDVRVVNLMLLNMDWYIDEMKQKAYSSDPLPISMNYNQYMTGKRDRTYLIERTKEYVELKQAIEFVASDDPKTKEIQGYDQQLEYIPGKNFSISVDTTTVFANGTVNRKDASKVLKSIEFSIKGNSLDKSQLITLDIIAHNDWKRPIYFVTCNTEGICGLDQYLQLEGFAYRLVPIKTDFTNYGDCGRIATDTMYNNIMNKFIWGRMNEPDVYMDNFHIRTLSIIRFRNNFNRLAESLIVENKKDSAIAVLDKCYALAPPEKIPEDFYIINMAETYLKAGAVEKGENVLRHYFNTCDDYLNYYMSLKPGLRALIDYDIRYNLQVLNDMQLVSQKYGLTKLQKEIDGKLNGYSLIYSK